MNNFKGSSFQTVSRWDQADSVRELKRKNPWSSGVESKRRMRVYMIHWRTCSGLQISLYTHQGLRTWWKLSTLGLHVLQLQLLHVGSKHCCIWSMCGIKLMSRFSKILYVSIVLLYSSLVWDWSDFWVDQPGISEQLCGLRGHCQSKYGEIRFYCEVPNCDLNALGHVASPEFHARTWRNTSIRSCTRQVRWMVHVVWALYSCSIDIVFPLRAFSKLPLPNLSSSLMWPDCTASVSPVQSFHSPWIQHWDKHHVYSCWILVLTHCLQWPNPTQGTSPIVLGESSL